MYVLDAQSFLDKVFFESDSRPWRQSTHGQQIHLLGDDQEEQLKALTKITRETFISGGDGRLFTSIFLVCSIKNKKKNLWDLFVGFWFIAENNFVIFTKVQLKSACEDGVVSR